MSKQKYRFFCGVVLGSILGLCSGLVSQYINHLLLPGVPLYQPPFGPEGNVVFALVLGIILGGLVSITETSLTGVVLSAALGALILLVAGTISGTVESLLATASIIMVLFLLVPFTGMMVPVMALVRIAINKIVDYRSIPLIHPTRWWLSGVLILASIGIAFATRYPADGQVVVARFNSMLADGVVATQPAFLADPLRKPLVGEFLNNAGGQSYQISWSKRNINRYGIPRPGVPEHLISIAIARFSNGWNLVCLYPTMDSEPVCRGFSELP